MTVTEILPINKKKSRIYLDDDRAFVLYNNEIRHFCLTPSCEMSEQTYNQIVTEILLKRARSRALHLLERQDRTERQLREKLQQNEYPNQVIDDALNYVKSFHYIDDNRFSRNYIRFHCDKKSRRQIFMALLRKGVAKEVIEEAYDEIAEELDLEEKDSQLIQMWIEKKRISLNALSEKEYQKFYRFLLNKGFAYEEINHVLRRY